MSPRPAAPPPAPGAPPREVWESFWRRKARLEEVYSNEGRIAAELARVASLRGQRALEVGAGTGRDSADLARAGAEVTVLDYAESSLALVRAVAAREGVALRAVRGDALALPFRSGSFTMVFHQGLLEHFRDPRPLLRENLRALRPGGLLLVDVPQRYHLYTAVKHLLIALGRWFAGWETEYSPRALEGLVEGAGCTLLGRYGDWMVPSFFYRSGREVLLRAGVRLPLYPRGPRSLRGLRARVRGWAHRQRWAPYTYFTIGVIGRKGG